MRVAIYEKASLHHEASHCRGENVKRRLLLPSHLREFLEVLRALVLKVLRASLKFHRAVLKVLRASLKFHRAVLKVLRASLKFHRAVLKVLRHLCDLQSECSQLRGELGRFKRWHFDTRGTNEIEIAHNSEGILKLIDLPGEVAKAKQIEGGHVFEESHAVHRFSFGRPGLFNDPVDLIFGTDYLYGHSDNLDRDLQWMSSC
jgi:hypothetical protein